MQMRAHTPQPVYAQASSLQGAFLSTSNASSFVVLLNVSLLDVLYAGDVGAKLSLVSSMTQYQHCLVVPQDDLSRTAWSCTRLLFSDIAVAVFQRAIPGD